MSDGKAITPATALALMLASPESETCNRIMAGEPFVFIVVAGSMSVEFIKDGRTECGTDGCPRPGIQYGRCWEHAPY